MTYTRLINATTMVSVELVDSKDFVRNEPPMVKIIVPKFAMLIDVDTYGQLSQDPPAMAAFIKMKMHHMVGAEDDISDEWPTMNQLKEEREQR